MQWSLAPPRCWAAARQCCSARQSLDLIEDERLVPGGVQGVLLSHHRLLALVQEGDDCIGICVGRAQGRETGHSRDREEVAAQESCGHKAEAGLWLPPCSSNVQAGDMSQGALPIPSFCGQAGDSLEGDGAKVREQAQRSRAPHLGSFLDWLLGAKV